MTRGKKFLDTTVNRRALVLTATVVLVVGLIVTGSPLAQAQSCRTVPNPLILNLVDTNNSTVTNLGSNNFRIHFAFVSDPSITLLCADSGLHAPCGFDGAYFRSKLSSHIIAESGGGSCNLTSTITTDGGTSVILGYQMKFELNGNPSQEQFILCMATDVIGVGQTVSLLTAATTGACSSVP